MDSVMVQSALVMVVLLLGANAVVANKPSAKDSTTRASSLTDLCTTIGAEYIIVPESQQPTCRLYVQHQGTQRFADVYFPASYSTSTEVPLWFHLHGLYRAVGPPPPAVSLRQPGQQLQQQAADNIKRAAEHVADKWGSVKGWLGKEAILVYPDASGVLPGFQMWNSGFWQCPYKTDPKQCVDGEVDDVGFLELLTQSLLGSLPSKPTGVYIMGFSNGGMIITTLLCKSEYFRTVLTAATLAGTVLRKSYLEEACSPRQQQQQDDLSSDDDDGDEEEDSRPMRLQEAATSARQQAEAAASKPTVAGAQQQEFQKLPLLFIHGMADTLFPFYEGSRSAIGDVLLSTIEMVDAWAARYGCPGSAASPPLVYLAGEGVACRDFCHSPKPSPAFEDDNTTAGMTEQQQEHVIWLCAMEGQKHDWSPFMADLAWTFYHEHQQHTAALAEPDYPVWQVTAQHQAPASPSVSPAPAQLSQPNTTAPTKQQQQQARGDAGAVASATAAGKGTPSAAAAAVSTSSTSEQPASIAITKGEQAPAPAGVSQQAMAFAAFGNPSRPPPGSVSTNEAGAARSAGNSSSSSSHTSSSKPIAAALQGKASVAVVSSSSEDGRYTAAQHVADVDAKRAEQGAGQAAPAHAGHSSVTPAGSHRQ